jgi:CDP-diglyceride synthetase
MSYFVYFLFVVWLLSGLGGLLAGVLIKFGPTDAPRVSNRPAWFQFVGGAYTLSVAALLFWLYRSGLISEWWVLIIGSVILIPEVLYMIFSRRR